VVEAAEADVVGPAVAADDPDARADEGSGERLEPSRLRGVNPDDPLEQGLDALALRGDAVTS